MTARTRLSFCLWVCPTPSCIRFLLLPRGDLQENETGTEMAQPGPLCLGKDTHTMRELLSATPQRNLLVV